MASHRPRKSFHFGSAGIRPSRVPCGACRVRCRRRAAVRHLRAQQAFLVGHLEAQALLPPPDRVEAPVAARGGAGWPGRVPSMVRPLQLRLPPVSSALAARQAASQICVARCGPSWVRVQSPNSCFKATPAGAWLIAALHLLQKPARRAPARCRAIVEVARVAAASLSTAGVDETVVPELLPVLVMPPMRERAAAARRAGIGGVGQRDVGVHSGWCVARAEVSRRQREKRQLLASAFVPDGSPGSFGERNRTSSNVTGAAGPWACRRGTSTRSAWGPSACAPDAAVPAKRHHGPVGVYGCSAAATRPSRSG